MDCKSKYFVNGKSEDIFISQCCKAPETYLNNYQPSVKVDIFAAGIILFILLNACVFVYVYIRYFAWQPSMFDVFHMYTVLWMYVECLVYLT